MSEKALTIKNYGGYVPYTKEMAEEVGRLFCDGEYRSIADIIYRQLVKVTVQHLKNLRCMRCGCSPLWEPCCHCTKEEIEAYLKQHPMTVSYSNPARQP